MVALRHFERKIDCFSGSSVCSPVCNRAESGLDDLAKQRIGCVWLVLILTVSISSLTACSVSIEDRNGSATAEWEADSCEGEDAPELEEHVGTTLSEVPKDHIVGVDDIREMIKMGESLFIVDIRSTREYDKGFIEGSINIPAGSQFEARVGEIELDRKTFLIDHEEDRVTEAYRILIEFGANPENLYVASGGMRSWISSGYPINTNVEKPC